MVNNYNKNMKMALYDTKEIEIVEDEQFVFYFESITELADLINTNKKIAKELKELLVDGG